MIARQPAGFRQSMSWLHTWAGLLAGWLLFAVFVTGSLSFFQNEITVWMQPEVHATHDDGHGVERALALLGNTAPTAKRWTIDLPNPRSPLIHLSWGSGGRNHEATHADMDPASGALIQPRKTAGGRFLFDFHYQLYGMEQSLGNWIVGIATMFMFVVLVTGVIIHRHIFKDFFTFRPGKGKRSWLDAHNLSGVVALPFHLVITFSGLLLLGTELLPAITHAAYGGNPHGMHAEIRRPATPLRNSQGEPAPLTDIAPLLAAAKQQWPDKGVRSITITQPGDAKAIVELRSVAAERLENRGMPERLRFDGATGAALEVQEDPPTLAHTLFNSLHALHIGYFAQPLARWLLFVSGLLGCGVIASGLVIWVISRQKEREALGRTPFSHRLVEVLNVGAVSGLLVAIAAYFWASRLIPVDLAERNLWEIRAFFIAWALSLVHAALRRHKSAWIEQLGLAGALTLLLPVLNGVSGGLPLPSSLSAGHLQVAGFDLCAFMLGLLLLICAQRTALHIPHKQTHNKAAACEIADGIPTLMVSTQFQMEEK